MGKIKDDLKVGLKAEKTVKPILERLFGELTKTEDPYHNFDFTNYKYYVEHKRRYIPFGKYDSLIFDKVKYDKYLELKQKEPHKQFFICWSLSSGLYMWEFKENDDEFYLRDKYDVDRGCWDNTKKQICVLNKYIDPFYDFEKKVVKKSKKSKT